jgi:prepilin-type processing-associated H-X9-DG protein
LLYFTKAIPDARVFYCPSLNSSSSSRNFDYYATQSWPSTPVGAADDNVRAAYNYYPQPKTRAIVTGPLGNVSLPVLNYQPMTFASPIPGDPVQSSLTSPEPLKIGHIDPTKSVSWDIAQSLATLNHKSSGRPGGVNVLYGDGHVQFTPVRGNISTAKPFWNGFWQIDPGNDGPGNGDTYSQLFRALADSFQ